MSVFLCPIPGWITDYFDWSFSGLPQSLQAMSGSVSPFLSIHGYLSISFHAWYILCSWNTVVKWKWFERNLSWPDLIILYPNIHFWRLSETMKTSVITAGSRTQIRTQDIPNTKQECWSTEPNCTNFWQRACNPIRNTLISALTMEAIFASETLVSTYKSTRRLNPGNQHQHPVFLFWFCIRPSGSS
jgi:hypothetical protein